MKAAVIDTGTANLASVLAALARHDVKAERTRDPDVVAQAEAVVLPGVGSFRAAAETLSESGLVEPIQAFVQEGRPFLAVCLGFQLLAPSSAESPGVSGLGIHDEPVVALENTERVPHLGWNEVEGDPSAAIVRSGHAYFAHSYAVAAVPRGFVGARCTHGTPFVAAIERGALLATQFHPELSGAWGHALVGRWLRRVGC